MKKQLEEKMSGMYLMIPELVHQELKIRAIKKKIPMKDYVVNILVSAVEGKDNA